MEEVKKVDTAGTQFFKEMYEILHAQGTKVLFAGLQPKVIDYMKRSGVIEKVGD